MIDTTISRLNACMTCGNQVNEIVDVNGAYAVAHFCDDFDTIVVGQSAKTLDDLLIRWNAENASETQD